MTEIWKFCATKYKYLTYGSNWKPNSTVNLSKERQICIDYYLGHHSYVDVCDFVVISYVQFYGLIRQST